VDDGVRRNLPEETAKLKTVEPAHGGTGSIGGGRRKYAGHQLENNTARQKSFPATTPTAVIGPESPKPSMARSAFFMVDCTLR